MFFLGLGQNALTLTAAVLTVMVIDDDVFSEVFGSMVRFNEEGEIVAVGGGTPTEGVPFTEAAVRRMLETEPMTASCASCLALAWKHRDTLEPVAERHGGLDNRKLYSVALLVVHPGR